MVIDAVCGTQAVAHVSRLLQFIFTMTKEVDARMNQYSVWELLV